MFETIMTILLFCLGLALASFYIAQIYRIEKEIPFPDFVTRDSFCEGCKKKLKWYELIPVISYIFQKGKCAKCGYKISITYPIFELINGITIAILYFRNAPIDYYLFSQFLFFLAVYDFYYKGFPKNIMHTFLAISFVFAVYKFIFQYNFSLAVVVVAFSIIIVIIIMNMIKKSFGTGDLLIVLMLSFIINLKEFIAVIFFSIIIAGLVSIFLVLIKRGKKGDTIPFVPFMHLGFIFLYVLYPLVEKYFVYLSVLW